jgi:hypothetical protein
MEPETNTGIRKMINLKWSQKQTQASRKRSTFEMEPETNTGIWKMIKWQNKIHVEPAGSYLNNFIFADTFSIKLLRI